MGVDDVDVNTPLFIDMHICAEMLHCPHEEFLKLPRIEKNKYRHYLLTKGKKKEKEIKEMESKTSTKDRQQQLLDDTPKTR